MKSTTASRIGERAVVVGGGIAGLAAATVLSSRFERVDVLERDHYTREPSVRPHAPQGAHVHVLLAGGLHALTRLVPELPRWFDEMGMPEGDLTEHVRLAHAGRWLAKVRSGIPVRSCSRPVLEHLLLRKVSACANVDVVTGCQVLQVCERDGHTVLSYEREGQQTQVRADLVVDASGRSALSRKWLQTAGAEPVAEAVVDAGIVYSSCAFETAGPIADDWMVLGVMPQVPNDPHSAAVMRIGPNRVLCAMISYGRPKPPTGPEELVERARSLCVGEVHQIMRDARPISEVHNFSSTANRFRHYADLRAPIDRVVVIGDALCSLNPRFGQGMTVAALGAEQLGVALDRHHGRHHGRHAGLAGFSREFQRQMTKVLRTPWQMALLEDKMWASALFGPPAGRSQRVLAGVTSRVLDAVFSDVDAFIRFMRVAHMLDSPAQLLSAKFTGALLRRGQGAPAPAPGVGLRET